MIVHAATATTNRLQTTNNRYFDPYRRWEANKTYISKYRALGQTFSLDNFCFTLLHSSDNKYWERQQFKNYINTTVHIVQYIFITNKLRADGGAIEKLILPWSKYLLFCHDGVTLILLSVSWTDFRKCQSGFEN